ncbi:MAG TPA: sterol desaturase family protein [Alphaproteobacteria bacterium]|jgi:sterol desaturase/sphingolipid hydroxylase (fatty acid hydroxylase superfamily)|nr:sterol desaturase family protein [Alphaproteobacteria bacterium]
MTPVQSKRSAIPGRSWTGRSYDLGKMSFRDLVIAYSTYYAIDAYLIVAAISATVAIHVSTGWVPAAIGGTAAFVVYPFAWYLIHRFILHSRSLYKSRWTAGTWKRIHFDHHQDPHRLEVLFGALSTTLPTIAAVTLPVGWLLGGAAGAASALCVGLLTTCAYEFGHCVQHLNYQPKNPFLKRVKRWHLAHHFYNEQGNYGIMSFLPDRMFGTWYDARRDVPRSATVFNLGYDLAEAVRYPYVARLTGAPPRDRPPSAGESGAGEASVAEPFSLRRRSMP